MADDGEDGDLEDGGHGAVSASPATSPPVDVEPTMSKLQSEFNFMEFVQLASWVIDVGDTESMAALMKLKRQWTAKFGGEVASDDRWGLHPVQSAELFVPPSPTWVAQPLVVTRVSTPSGWTAPLTHPSPPWASPPHVDVWASSPPTLAVSTVPPSIDSMLRLNELSHHQSPAVSSPPTSVVQPTVARAHSPSWDRVELPQEHATPAPLPAPQFRLQPPELFIGNVPLHPHLASKIDEDKIAAAFHNSSRKTLKLIPPSVQNGEVIVRPSIDMIRAGSHRWNTTAVGYFLDKKPYFYHLNEFVRSIWPGVRDVKATSNGFFFPIQNCLQFLIFFLSWHKTKKTKTQKVSVWIKLRHLPVELWTTEGLSTVASGIGRPLYCDAITRACMRLDFARVCVMLNVSSKLPKHVFIMMPNELGGESACKVDVEYEWLPPKCTGCSSLGHRTKKCPLSKPTKPAVSIFVRKSMPSTPAAPKLKLREQVQAAPVPEVIHPETEVDRVSEEMLGHGRDKGGTTKLQFEILLASSGYTLSLYWKLGFYNLMSHVFNQEFYLDGDGLLIMRDRGLIDLAVTVGNVPLLVGGDFNAVLDMSETGLLSLPMQGERFTWHNCSLDGWSLWKRLDRLLVNDVWMDRWPNLYYTCLTPCTSDHSPLVLKGDCRNMQVSLFRFDNYLALSPGFLASVSFYLAAPYCWYSYVFNDSKLEALKPVFRQQRRCKGDLAMNVKMAAGYAATESEASMAERWRPMLQDFLPSWPLGFVGGDRTARAIDLQYLRPWARHILTDDEAQALIRPVTSDEVKTAFFDIEEDKAPGPDGFSSGFFKAAWPVVGRGVERHH
ncbi:hypothetical protein Sango_2864400 [Sesamum angolense]|uniref:DUF4283 domain-containing protein n=1 Tax=Sesamum angolense TaxID=2727404 RepID=A0AAE1T6T9_9LAMI|nr:hypothetical protein Sango_2864400 [Sesamum angolense]